jgi:hypothetical protein
MATHQQGGNNQRPEDVSRAPRSDEDTSQDPKKSRDPKKSQDQIGRTGGLGSMPSQGQQSPSRGTKGDPQIEDIVK